jgi:hypothetical protein
VTFTELLLFGNWKVSEYVPLAILVVVAVLLQELAPAFEHVIVAPAITAFVTESRTVPVMVPFPSVNVFNASEAAPRAAT